MTKEALRCPECGAECEPSSTSLDGRDDDLAHGLVLVDFTCPECKAEFTDVFRLESQETTSKPEVV